MKAHVGALWITACAAMGCSTPPAVVQGETVSFDPSRHELILRDERVPGVTSAYDVSSAEVGAEPKPNDRVRVAYYQRGDARFATRVMNLTRQAELRTGH